MLPATFHQFTSLPVDIQIMTWKFASSPEDIYLKMFDLATLASPSRILREMLGQLKFGRTGSPNFQLAFMMRKAAAARL